MCNLLNNMKQASVSQINSNKNGDFELINLAWFECADKCPYLRVIVKMKIYYVENYFEYKKKHLPIWDEMIVCIARIWNRKKKHIWIHFHYRIS